LNPPTALSAPPQSHSRFAFKRRAASTSILRRAEVRHPFSIGRVRWPRTGLSCTEPQASRPSGFDPSRDHESLAGGTRLRVPFHSGVAITPLCGCLLNRSRDRSRSRVPPRFPRRRYADAPAAASFSCLRFAAARSRSPGWGGKSEAGIRGTAVVMEPHVPFGARCGAGAFRRIGFGL